MAGSNTPTQTLTAGTVKLPPPSPGKTITIQISLHQLLEIPFSMENVSVFPLGNDLHIAFPDQAELILKGFVVNVAQGTSPLMFFSDGSVIDGGVLLTALMGETV